MADIDDQVRTVNRSEEIVGGRAFLKKRISFIQDTFTHLGTDEKSSVCPQMHGASLPVVCG